MTDEHEKDWEICEAATPGPWRLKKDEVCNCCAFVLTSDGYGVTKVSANSVDAQFIIHARTRMPELLREAEQRDREISELKAELREVKGMFCHSLAYKDDTIHDKSSALEVVKTFGWDCFEQPKEQGDE